MSTVILIKYVRPRSEFGFIIKKIKTAWSASPVMRIEWKDMYESPPET